MAKQSSSSQSGLTIWQLIIEYYRLCGPCRRFIPLQLCLTFIDALIQSSIPFLIGYVVDQITTHPWQFVHQQLPWLSLGVIIATMVFYLVAYTQHYLAQYIGNNAGVSFQVTLYNHLQRLGADFYQRTRVGEITSRLTNDINQGVMPLYMQFMGTSWALFMILISSSFLYVRSPRLLLLVLVVSIVMVVVTKSMRVRIQKLNREVRDEAGRISARITEDISANALIRAFARENAFSDSIRDHSAVYLTKALRTARVTTIFSDVMNTFMGVLAPSGILLAGALLVVRNGISIGALVMMQQSWSRIAGPISNVLTSLNVLYAALASMDRIFEFLHETPLIKDRSDAKRLRVPAGNIEMRDVLFSYPADEQVTVLDHLSLSVPAKKSLALVGESGAGKSTIVQLLLRFYDPQGGQILIDAQEIRTVTQQSLRENIGFVMQETILLSGTIRENMLFVQPDATNSEIINALKRAKAWDFIRQMPQGLETMLGERGARLSGGQKQRLSIARVFLKNPPIVIFDEATSALDTITENQILETMRELFHERTVITIAHRLSTVVDCDEIVLLDQGHIVARGRHTELLQTSTRYKELCAKQLVPAE